MRTIRTKVATHALLNFGAPVTQLKKGLADASLQGLREVERKEPQTKAAYQGTNSKADGSLTETQLKRRQSESGLPRQTAFFLIRSSQTGMTTKWVDEQVRLNHTLLKR